MCLEKVGPKKVAGRNIKCYKVIFSPPGSRIYFTPYVGAKVEIGETYHSIITRQALTNNIDKALHSFMRLEDAIIEKDSWMADSYSTYRVVECIIPKGSEYYRGVFAINGTEGAVAYASNCIKYIKFVKTC